MNTKDDDENNQIDIISEIYDIPTSYIALLKEERNIKKLWKPQAEALQKGILGRDNFLMISTPGSGKTLVAELILLKSYLDTQDPSVYLVPFKALATQKHLDFNLILGHSSIGLKVGLSTGDTGEKDTEAIHSNIIVMTYEKFNYFVKNYPNWIAKLGCLVIDEINYIGDRTRGPELEITITYMKERFPDVKLVGLTAVIPNYGQISEWMGGDCYYNLEWRKNPLHEGIYDPTTNKITFYEDGILRNEEKLGYFVSNPVSNCVLDYLSKNEGNLFQFLIYVPTRRDADNIARNISELVESRFALGSLGLDVSSLNSLKREIEEFSEIDSAILKRLKETLSNGIAFHRAGMRYRTRKAIENAFEKGEIMGIVATSTLSMGINLPVKRIFISSPRYGGTYGRNMSVGEYKNLAGRAGRPAFSNEPGESVLIAAIPLLTERFRYHYIMGNPEEIISQIGAAENFEGIVLSLINDYPRFEDLLNFMTKTYFGMSFEDNVKELGKSVSESVKKLVDWDFLIEERQYSLTQLGSSVAKQIIRPFTAHYLLRMTDKLRSHGNDFITWLLIAIFSTPEFQTGERFWADFLYPHREQVRDFLEIDHLSLKEIDECILTANIIKMWIEGKKVKDIYEKNNINQNYWGQGDLEERIAPIVCRVLRSIRSILEETNTDIFSQYGETLRHLEYRVRYGIRQNQLPFVEKGIVLSRRMIDIIDKKGIYSPEDLLEDISELGKKIGRKNAVKLKRTAVQKLLRGYDKEKELILLEAYEEKLDIELFINLLETWEKNFHRAVIESMHLMDDVLEWNPCDESGNEDVPDIIAFIESETESIGGKIGGQVKVGIECKSTRGLEKSVSRYKALDIVKKCPSDEYAYKIVIGTPDFVEEATEGAKKHRFLLIPVAVFARLLLYVRKGKFKEREIQEIFQKTGRLSHEDLREF